MSTHSEAVLNGMEQQLAMDESGDLARSLVGRFAGAADRLQVQLRTPLAQQEYREVEAMHAALVTAADVVGCVWQQMHSNQKLCS